MATIYPGKGLGSLALGSSLQSVVHVLKASPTTFPSISIIYSKKNPVKSPIIIVLKYNGLRLRFDGMSQKLRLIEVVEWGKMKLTYKNRDVGSQGSPSYVKIYNDIFGPTFPGKYYHEHNLYVLSYPGIAFSFHISAEAVKKLDPTQDIPRVLMSSSGPTCAAMAIFQGEYWWDVEHTLFPVYSNTEVHSPVNKPKAVGSAKLPSSQVSIDSVYADEIQGTAVLHFATHPRRASSFCIKLNKTTIQDVVMILGPPSERFFKEDSRLSIFNPVDGSEELERATLFFNYFTLGIDVCFDTSKKNATVKKLIFHGNVPGTVSFQKYERCRWRLHSRSSGEAEEAEGYHEGHEYSEYDEHGQPRRRKSSTSTGKGLTPNSEMKFAQFAHLYEFKKTPVLLNHRLDNGNGVLNDDGMEIINEDDDDDIIEDIGPNGNFQNPRVSTHLDDSMDAFAKDKLDNWGLAELYGAPGIVVEVLKNGDVSSLTIY